MNFIKNSNKKPKSNKRKAAIILSANLNDFNTKSFKNIRKVTEL